MTRAFEAGTFALAFLASACSGADGSGEPQTGGFGGSGATGGPQTGGCSRAPDCGGCQVCFDRCYCETGDVDGCVSKCQSAGGAGGGGQGGTGSGGVSGTGPGGSSGTGTGGAGPGGAGPGGAGPGGAGPGGTGGQGGSGVGGTGTGGTGGTGLPPGTQTATIQTTPFTVAPGQEVFKCQNFANPLPGDAAILHHESFMTPGSHHMFVFFTNGGTNGPLADCTGAEFEPYLHLAQTPQEGFSYPPGVGRRLSKSQGLRILMHYVNTGSASIQAEVRFVMQWVPPDQISQLASTFFFNNSSGINVPPLQSGSATMTCNISSNIKLLSAVSHMHRHGTHFKATTNTGVVLYEGTEWDEPKTRDFAPPFDIAAGTRITHVCDYQNSTNTTLRFGSSAITNEMCIFQGTFYPSTTGNVLGCSGF